jgi:hypothetical protein
VPKFVLAFQFHPTYRLVEMYICGKPSTDYTIITSSIIGRVELVLASHGFELSAVLLLLMAANYSVQRCRQWHTDFHEELSVMY